MGRAGGVGHLQAGEPHEEAAHGEGAGPADALEGIAGAEASERAEGHRACARRDPGERPVTLSGAMCSLSAAVALALSRRMLRAWCGLSLGLVRDRRRPP